MKRGETLSGKTETVTGTLKDPASTPLLGVAGSENGRYVDGS